MQARGAEEVNPDHPVRLLRCEILLLNSSPSYLLDSLSTTDIGMLTRPRRLVRKGRRTNLTNYTITGLDPAHPRRTPRLPSFSVSCAAKPRTQTPKLATFSHPLRYEGTDPPLQLLHRVHRPHFLPEQHR